MRGRILWQMAGIWPVNVLGGLLLLGVFLCLAIATAVRPAGAADLPSKIEAPVFQPPPPVFSWTGFYAGVNIGGGTDHFAFPYFISRQGAPGGNLQGTSGITASGPVGGIQAGFNYELPFFHLVAGVEADLEASGIRGKTTTGGVLTYDVHGTTVFGSPAVATFGSKFMDYGTARLRIGYAWDRFLPYFTAGFSFGTTETSYSLATPTFVSSGSVTQTRTGVFPHVGTLGIGLEYALMPNVTVRAEYFYEFINARTLLFVPEFGTPVSFNTRTMYHIARAGLNYKFDFLSPLAAPVVAKY